MKVGEILEHIRTLPKSFEFDWTGVEQWHPEVFDREVKTLDEAVAYIKELKERVARQSFAIHELADRYNEIIDWIAKIEILSK